MAKPCISENTKLVESQFSVEPHICGTECGCIVSIDHLVRLSILCTTNVLLQHRLSLMNLLIFHWGFLLLLHTNRCLVEA